LHPSRVIRGRTTRLLDGRHILVGVSGSIAAVEVPKIIRELIRHGADVRAVMSPEATRIVSAEALEFATGHPPILQLTGNVEHVTFLGPGEGQADLYLVAPATANTISKIAHGIDDTPVTSFASIALGGGVPLLVAVHGANAEGEEKIATPEEVAAAVLHRLAQGPWSGRRVVVIGGAARESVDSVRALTNESSGATALALATQAHYRGAEVELWAAAVQVPIPPFLHATRWRGVRDLLALAHRKKDELARSAAILVPAALSDFTVEPREGKISSRSEEPVALTLRKAPKVLPVIRRLAPPPTRLVAFKLLAGEGPERLVEEGRRLREESRADWVVANDVATMGSPDTEALVLAPGAEPRWIRAPKPEFAGQLLEEIGRELPAGSGASRTRSGSPVHRRARRPPTARRRRPISG